ncbi:MAG: hypothetical protein M1833_001615 [Piccolia ochrophora]|nr:MAG: hypothetical protein M1833_001615 [Piccolia ochrophora]
MSSGRNNSSSNRAGNTAGSSNPSQSNSERPSRNSVVKQGWGSFPKFLLSYGLKPEKTEDWEEDNRILDALIEAEMEEKRR